MAARSGGDILRMVYWYNISPRSGQNEHIVPSQLMFSYAWKTPGFSPSEDKYIGDVLGFNVGQTVFVKPPHARCTTQWSTGVVTGTRSPVAVEVDGVPRHVADVRAVPISSDVDDAETQDADLLTRPQRMRRFPRRFDDYTL
jgi:hypothetical protein